MISVTWIFDLWPWSFAWTSLLSLVISHENFMMIRLWEYIQKGVTDRQTDIRTDGRTDWIIHRAAWSQLKWWVVVIRSESAEMVCFTKLDTSTNVRFGRQRAGGGSVGGVAGGGWNYDMRHRRLSNIVLDLWNSMFICTSQQFLVGEFLYAKFGDNPSSSYWVIISQAIKHAYNTQTDTWTFGHHWQHFS